MTPDVLVIGHLTKDIVGDGWRLGGVHYAATQFSRLGMRVGVVTAYGAEIEHTHIPRVEWSVVNSMETTTFENLYGDGKREQRVLGKASTLGYDDIPPEWRDAPIVFFSPVLDEIDEALPSQIAQPETLIALGAQGWLRRLDDSQVRPVDFEVEPAWLHGQIVFVSEEDVSDADAVSGWQEKVRMVVLTRGRSGYTIWNADGAFTPPTQLVAELDPTGAGDVFAAAFVYKYALGGDPLAAGRFAHAAASLAVQGEGVDGIGTRAEIEAQVQREAAVGAG
jgi:sugar/nucleoside kinase (ribokinase family)